ncbi:SDR family NAD(P)-dependent oxidoreductase [Lacticaseibacillus kribbianus]|uniref:SDR family NAD(P)-dependent oxidoreductase n=1 Tax=Lacticaseibacillus kribbianus TaxID=2926292 RepID=UPI001CD3D494|nr:SDR family NAD(P)-dependent oxidoreductase [Lacticaseibacillus kribbianus]
MRLVLITGATDGIGKMTALKLAGLGMHVIVHGRNPQKAQDVVAELKAASHNPNIDYLIADLLDPAAIKAMVQQFTQRYPRLDVLINNAGAVFDNQRRETKQGIEVTMALNVMAPFLLNQLLLPSLRQSDDGRIINLSSAAHQMSGRPDMADLNLQHTPSAQRRYGLSKRFLIWNTQTQAAWLSAAGITNVTVNAAHPGTVATKFGQASDKGFVNNAIYKTAITLSKFPPIGRHFSVEHGAATDVYLASSPEVAGVTGKYFGNSREQQPATKKDSPQNRAALWQYCQTTLAAWL